MELFQIKNLTFTYPNENFLQSEILICRLKKDPLPSYVEKPDVVKQRY